MWLKSADMAECDRCACLQVLVKCRRLLIRFSHLGGVRQKNGKQVVNGLEGGELVACRVRLGADVLKCLACVEPHNVVFLFSTTDPEALDDHLNSPVGQLPDRVNLLVIKLSRSVEHVLAKSCDRSSPNLFVLLLHRLDKLLADLAFG